MAIIKRTIQNVRLTNYLAAVQAILAGQAYQIGNRSLTRANLGEVREAINELIAAGGVPLDGDDYDLDDNSSRSRSKRVIFRD